MVWFLAIFGGAIADRLGFRRALSIAYLILAAAYFLIGSVGASWLAPIRNAVPLGLFVGVILILPALGISMVKPSVVGTTARASKPNVRSIGYSIYYTMVNIGGAAGPYVAGWAHKHLGLEPVFRISALSVFAMFFLVLFLFREPSAPPTSPPPPSLRTLRNFLVVLGNPKFMLFLLIFTGYWIVYWQQYISLPGYVHAHIDANASVEWILVTDAAAVIALTLLINYLTRKIPAFTAIIIGTLVTSLSWLILAFHPTVLAATSLSSSSLSAKSSISRATTIHFPPRPARPARHLHGFCISPLGIGSLLGGWFGGKVMHHYAEVEHHPAQAWYVITAVGILTAFLLLIYDRVVKPSQATE